jgi:nucleoside-diphosphate-sugar epimerase
MTTARHEGAILITGATGFIGRHVARRLYQTGFHVMALTRDQGGITARRRVEKALQISDSNDRLEVIHSDLSQPGAGLCQSDLARLRRTVQTVIHCAGDTSFFPQSLSASRALSIDGPIALLVALGGGRLERWCQISTAFVCGRRCGTVFESEGAVGQDFHNPYEEIKLESEMALRDACSRLEVDLRILRPSVVIGPESSTQGGSPSSLLYDFIRLAAAISGRGKNGKFAVRIQGRPSAHFNIVPIEYVSAAIEALSKQPGAAGGTFHLVVSQPPTQEAMLQMITSRLGVNGLRLIDESCEPMRDGSLLENRLARMLAPYREYLEQDVSFDDSGARSLLGTAGICCSRLDEKTIDDFIAMALSQTRERVSSQSRREAPSRP